MGFVADQQYLSKAISFDTAAFGEYYPVRDIAEDSYFHLHFLEHTKSIYVETFLTQVAAFLLLKLLFALGMRVFGNCPKVILMLSYFEGSTLLWFLPMVMIGDNLIYLSFSCGAQLRAAFSFVSSHKANLTATAVCLFLLLTYSLAYLPLTYSYLSTRHASNGIYLCNPTLRGFVLESVLFAIRNLLNGFVHGFLLDHQELQSWLLIGVNTVVLLVVYFCSKEFRFKVAFVLAFLYYLGFILFNVLILLEMKGIGLGGFEYSWVGYRVLLVLLALACVRMLFEIGVLVK